MNFAITNDPQTQRNTLSVLLDDGTTSKIEFDPGDIAQLEHVNDIVRSGLWPRKNDR